MVRLTRRLERRSEPQKLLHITSDQGSIGWPSWYFLYCHKKLNGSFTWDYSHRFWNSARDAVSKAGSRLLTLTVTIVMNLTAGPFQSHAFGGQLRGCAEKYFSVSTPECPLFQWYYEDISKDMCDFSVPSFGTKGHMASVFGRCRQCPWWTSRGFHVKMSRWFSWFDKVEGMVPWWSVFALILPFCCKDVVLTATV